MTIFDFRDNCFKRAKNCLSFINLSRKDILNSSKTIKSYFLGLTDDDFTLSIAKQQSLFASLTLTFLNRYGCFLANEKNPNCLGLTKFSVRCKTPLP